MADNTIQALRVLQAGIEGVKAVGTQVWAVQPTAGKTFVIGAITYTVVASGASAAGEINAGADLAAWKVNVVAAINGTAAPNTSPNPYASAGVFATNNLPITARVPGPAGNSIVFTMPTPDAGNSVNGTGTLGATTSGSMARGTPVAATTRLAVEQLAWGADDENVYHPKVANGNLTRYTGPGTPVQHGTRFTLPSQAAIWEQMPLWFSMLLGAPVITGDVDGPWTFTWTSTPTTNPNPYAVTLERLFTNGLGGDVAENASYAMLSAFSLAFSANEELKINGGGGFARKFATMGGGITAGLTLPDFETMVSALTTVYFDSTFGAVGSTLLAEQVIGWNWALLPGVFPRPTAEGRTDLSFTKHQTNGEQRGIDAEITCLLDPTTYAAEITRAATPATNKFAVRIKTEGSNGRLLNIDFMAQHDKPLFAPGEDQGQDIVSFALKDCADSTNFLVVTLTLPNTSTLA